MVRPAGALLPCPARRPSRFHRAMHGRRAYTILGNPLGYWAVSPRSRQAEGEGFKIVSGAPRPEKRPKLRFLSGCTPPTGDSQTAENPHQNEEVYMSFLHKEGSR